MFRHGSVRTWRMQCDHRIVRLRFSQLKVADHFDHGLNILDRCSREYTVAQIKDMPWPAGGGSQNSVDLLLNRRQRRAAENYGVEIALHGNVVPDAPPGVIE